jgi:hypothetical protein
LVEKKDFGVDFGCVRMADGGNASVCAGRISLVSFLAFAVRAFGLDGAAHDVDG